MTPSMKVNSPSQNYSDQGSDLVPQYKWLMHLQAKRAVPMLRSVIVMGEHHIALPVTSEFEVFQSDREEMPLRTPQWASSSLYVVIVGHLRPSVLPRLLDRPGRANGSAVD